MGREILEFPNSLQFGTFISHKMDHGSFKSFVYVYNLKTNVPLILGVGYVSLNLKPNG